MFGRGSLRPFPEYFDGVSTVEVASVADVEHWLLGCHYASDQQLFGTPDHWLHPGEFEQIRMGDCDDHALWAWRKLVELGHPTSFVAGRWDGEFDDDELHTWLLTKLDGAEKLVETTSKTVGEMVRPFEEVRGAYRPFFAVNERFETRAYLGAVQDFFDWTLD